MSPTTLAPIELPSDQRPTVGSRVDRFTITEVLDELPWGEWGIAFLAECGRTRSPTVLMWASGLAGLVGPDAADLMREVATVSRAVHPSAILPSWHGWSAESFCVAYPHDRGSIRLSRFVADGVALPAPDAARIVAKVARILSVVHQTGLPHRDLRPSNLLLGGDGTVKLAGLGWGRVVDYLRRAHDPEARGSDWLYAAPEQRAGSRVGRRADIFSLGAVYYRLLTGYPPFPAGVPSIAEQTGGPDNLLTVPDPRKLMATVPAECSSIVSAAMGLRPHQRYPTADALASELERLANIPGGSSSSRSRPAFLGPAVSRNSGQIPRPSQEATSAPFGPTGGPGSSPAGGIPLPRVPVGQAPPTATDFPPPGRLAPTGGPGSSPAGGIPLPPRVGVPTAVQPTGPSPSGSIPNRTSGPLLGRSSRDSGGILPPPIGSRALPGALETGPSAASSLPAEKWPSGAGKARPGSSGSITGSADFSAESAAHGFAAGMPPQLEQTSFLARRSPGSIAKPGSDLTASFSSRPTSVVGLSAPRGFGPTTRSRTGDRLNSSRTDDQGRSRATPWLALGLILGLLLLGALLVVAFGWLTGRAGSSPGGISPGNHSIDGSYGDGSPTTGPSPKTEPSRPDTQVLLEARAELARIHEAVAASRRQRNWDEMRGHLARLQRLSDRYAASIYVELQQLSRQADIEATALSEELSRHAPTLHQPLLVPDHVRPESDPLGQTHRLLRRHKQALRVLAFSQKGKTLASASDDGAVQALFGRGWAGITGSCFPSR